jgi:hypothetical protein
MQNEDEMFARSEEVADVDLARGGDDVMRFRTDVKLK